MRRSTLLLLSLALPACAALREHFGQPVPHDDRPKPIPVAVHEGTVELGLVNEEARPDVTGNARSVEHRLYFAFRGTGNPASKTSYTLLRDGAPVGRCSGFYPDGANDKGGQWMRGPSQEAKDEGHQTWDWGPLVFQIYVGEDQGCPIDGPGHYAIRYAEDDHGASDIAFELAEVPSLAGKSLGIANHDLYDFADLRRGWADEYFWHRFDLKKPDQADELSIWVNVPTDLSGQKLPVEFTYYAGDELVGSETRMAGSDWSTLQTRLDRPVRVYSWPDGLTAAKVAAKPGPWHVNIVRNGAYLTTCTFDGGKLPALAMRIPCSPASDATVAASVARAKLVKLNADAKHRAKEARALAKSDEVRHAWRRAKYANDSADRAGAMSAGIEQQLSDRTLSRREREDLEGQKSLADSSSNGMGGAGDYFDKQYARLVEKYGR